MWLELTLANVMSSVETFFNVKNDEVTLENVDVCVTTFSKLINVCLPYITKLVNLRLEIPKR